MKGAKRVVVKIGTGVLTEGVGKLDIKRMQAICKQVADLRDKGFEIAIVSSGAVGLGMGKLGLKARPKQISAVQKCAAVGQGILIDTWAECFKPHNITIAQLLLTKDDVDVHSRHKSLGELFNEILQSGIVPVINENDTVSASELNIKFGDNDVLSALVSSMIKADELVILSTAAGLLDLKGDGKIIKLVEKIDARIKAMAGGTSSATAVGGMITKIRAAEIATNSGCGVYIASGAEADVLTKIFSGDNTGTHFTAAKKSVSSKKRWLAYFGHSRGKIFIDEGAINAIRQKGSSLLLAGVSSVEGNFDEHDLIEVMSAKKEIIARGLAHCGSSEMKKNIGKAFLKTDKAQIAIHRDNLALR